MRAIAVYLDERKVLLIDRDPPRDLPPGQVRLRVLEVGVCGTDHEIVNFQYGSAPKNEKYLVLGHEGLAEVAEIGHDVEGFEQGDLVVPMVRRPCPHEYCRGCRRGHPDFCYTGDFSERGIRHLHGYMNEYVDDEVEYVHRVPRELRPIAVLVEPLTIAEKALLQVWDIQERLPWECRHQTQEQGRTRGRSREGYCHRAVVLGAGPVGLLGAMLLRLYGFQTWVYSLQPAQSAQGRLAGAIGASYISGKDQNIEDLVSEIGEIDLVYEATGAATVSFEMLKHMGVNSIFVFTGVPGRKSPIECEAADIMRRMVLLNQVVLGTVNAGYEAYAAAIRDLGEIERRWPGAPASLITHRWPMAEFEKPLFGTREGIKHVIAIQQ